MAWTYLTSLAPSWTGLSDSTDYSEYISVIQTLDSLKEKPTLSEDEVEDIKTRVSNFSKEFSLANDFFLMNKDSTTIGKIEALQSHLLSALPDAAISQYLGLDEWKKNEGDSYHAHCLEGDMIEIAKSKKTDFTIIYYPCRSLPEKFHLLFSLKKVNIQTRVSVNGFREQLCKITGLTTLILRYNNCTTLPQEIANLTNLTRLDVCYNKLTILPNGMAYLKSLTFFNVSHNNLSSLKVICALKALKELHARNNNIKEIPKEISNLTGLEILDLSNNWIQNIPKEIGKLTQMKEINLANNGLPYLPEEICDLLELNKLNVNDNLLITLPREIGKVTSLKKIYMVNNRISRLPASVRQLTTTEIYVRDRFWSIIIEDDTLIEGVRVSNTKEKLD